MDRRASLWRREIQSEDERGSAEGEDKGEGRILDHVYCHNLKKIAKYIRGMGSSLKLPLKIA